MFTRCLLCNVFPVVVALAACGDSGSGASVDAAPTMMAPAVVSVACPATVPLTVDAPDGTFMFVFTPATPAIALGAVVKFTTHMEHDVVPDSTAQLTDTGLNVNFNETRCLMFKRTGKFGFKCQPHGFTGAITVQAGD